jgi:hypothetical protein
MAIGDATTSSDGIQPFLDLLNNGVNAYQQLKLADVQAARIQAGLPELTAEQVSAITGTVPDATIYPPQEPNWLPWVLGAIVVYLVVKD